MVLAVLEEEGGSAEGGRGPAGQARSAADGRTATRKCARRAATSGTKPDLTYMNTRNLTSGSK